MNILITRPLIDSEDLMGKLFSLGHKIVHIPTLKISASNANPVDAKKYDAFIFTSANAIRNLKLDNQDTNKICFCVSSLPICDCTVCNVVTKFCSLLNSSAFIFFVIVLNLSY